MYEIPKTIKLTKKEVCPECHFVTHRQALPSPSPSLISASLYQASQVSPPLSPRTPPQEASDLLNGLYSAFPPPNCHILRDQGALLAAVVLLPGVECGRP